MFKGKRIFDKANRIRIGKGIESRQKLEKIPVGRAKSNYPVGNNENSSI